VQVFEGFGGFFSVESGFLWFSLARLDRTGTLAAVTGILIDCFRGDSKKSRSMQAEMARRTRWNGTSVPGDGKALMNMKERWLSVEEIAAHLGVNRDTIYKWIERKKLPAHKVGRLWKFMASEVDEWVRAGKAGGDGGGGSEEK
jgi:excisionase family DNA binding protein